MTEREVVTLIGRALSRSMSNTELQKNHKDAFDSYFGRNRPSAVPGRSNHRSMDVADSVEAITAQIMPGFDYDEIATFDADGAHDVEQSRLESTICNRYLKINKGRIELQAAIRNALLLRNGITKTYVDKRVTVDEERYTGLDELELVDAQAKTHPNQSVKITKLEPNADDPELTDLNLTRRTEFRKLTIEAIDPANFVVYAEHTSIFLDSTALVGERRITTRSNLIARGFSKAKVNALPTMSTDVQTQSRNRDAALTSQDTPGDRSLDNLQEWELYIRADVDGDGIAELRKIVYIGQQSAGTILSNEMWPFQPYAAGTPFLLPNRFWGLSVYDKAIEIELLKTDGLRQYVDNLKNANFNEVTVLDGDVSMADVQNRRPGGHIRAERPDAVTPIPTVDTGSSSLAFLEYADAMRSERVGASLDLQNAAFQVAGESAHGVERVMAPKEQLAQLMARTLGETLIAETFRNIHRTLREFMPNTAEFPVARDRFVTATPGEWPGREEVTVVAGLSNAERLEKRQTMDALLVQQEKLFEAGQGDVLMSLETYHSALLDWSRAGGISSPRRYWLDPREPEQVEARERKEKQAADAAEEQRQMTERLFTTQVLIADRDNAADVVKHMSQLRFDYWKEVLGSEVEVFRVKAQGAEEAKPSQGDVEALQSEGGDRANA
jgi:hypothetical protein